MHEKSSSDLKPRYFFFYHQVIFVLQKNSKRKIRKYLTISYENRPIKFDQSLPFFFLDRRIKTMERMVREFVARSRSLMKSNAVIDTYAVKS